MFMHWIGLLTLCDFVADEACLTVQLRPRLDQAQLRPQLAQAQRRPQLAFPVAVRSPALLSQLRDALAIATTVGDTHSIQCGPRLMVLRLQLGVAVLPRPAVESIGRRSS